jgi:hypothetical protein
LPFEIRKQGSEFLVVTKGTNTVHGRFKSKLKALAQMRALYANVPEARRG